jgi:cation diffusion facilitator family transporter
VEGIFRQGDHFFGEGIMGKVEENLLMHGEGKQLAASQMAIAGASCIFLFSLTAGILSDSIALLLDAAMGFIFLLVTFFVRFIIKRVNWPPDHLFNFGYEKYEPLASIIQNVAIVTACAVAVNFAIQDIIHAEDITRYDLPVLASFVAGVIAIMMALRLRKIGAATRSQVLRTAAMQWFADGALSFGMFVGFLFGLTMSSLGYVQVAPYVDPVMAIILALLLMKLPVHGIIANLYELLDAVPGKDVQDAIRKIIERHKPKFFGIHRIRFRKAGKKVFLDICFFVDGMMAIEDAEGLALAFEKDLITELPDCDVVVYFKHK